MTFEEFKGEKMDRKTRITLWCASLPVLIMLIALLSPALEYSQDAIVGDAVITQTCFDRHGFNFVSRWSCRSALHRIGAISLAFSCSFSNKETDICKNLDRIHADNKSLRAQ